MAKYVKKNQLFIFEPADNVVGIERVYGYFTNSGKSDSFIISYNFPRQATGKI